MSTVYVIGSSNWSRISFLSSGHQQKEHIQWNPYIADTIGELHVGRYRGPAVAEGFISTIL